MRTSILAMMVTVLCVGAWAFAQGQQGTMQEPQGAQRANEPTPSPGGAMNEPSMPGQAGMRGGHQVLAPALIQSPNEMQIQGKVLSHKDVSVTGDKDHRIVRIQTKTGQTMDADLGRKDRLPSGLNINEGQWVIVTGVQGRLDNNNVLVAHNLASVFNFEAGGSQPGGATGAGGSSGKDISKDYDKDSGKTSGKDSSLDYGRDAVKESDKSPGTTDQPSSGEQPSGGQSGQQGQ